ncbi:MAG: hypothetical protein ACKOU6_13070, partial [Planctomycetota bacterium]
MARAAAKISATLIEPGLIFAAGAAAAGATELAASAAGAADWVGSAAAGAAPVEAAALAGAAPPDFSARAAARISATYIFFLSAINAHAFISHDAYRVRT